MANGNTRWRVKMDGNWITASAASGGAAFFLRAVYYFGFVNLADRGIGELIFRMVLPLLVLGCYFVLLRGLRLQAPVVYGGMAAGYCVIALISCFYSGDLLRIILGCVWYVICGGLLVITALGIISESRFAGWAIFLAAIVRLVFFDLGMDVNAEMILELAELLGLCCFACLPMSFKPERRVRNRVKNT